MHDPSRDALTGVYVDAIDEPRPDYKERHQKARIIWRIRKEGLSGERVSSRFASLLDMPPNPEPRSGHYVVLMAARCVRVNRTGNIGGQYYEQAAVA